ncbi:MAG: YtxH domain-containing protein [Flavobacterium sp.]
METGRTAAGVVLGLGIGALLGVLFAPNKGTKTRRKIMNKGQEYADGLKGKLGGLCQEVSDTYDEMVDDAKSLVAPK